MHTVQYCIGFEEETDVGLPSSTLLIQYTQPSLVVAFYQSDDVSRRPMGETTLLLFVMLGVPLFRESRSRRVATHQDASLASLGSFCRCASTHRQPTTTCSLIVSLSKA